MTKEAAHKITKLDRLLAEAETVTIVTHIHPDGDAVGSSVGMLHYLTELRGKDAAIAFSGPEAASLSFIIPEPDRPKLYYYTENQEKTRLRITASDLLVCLDCNSFQRTETMETLLRDTPAKKILIDHHPDPDLPAFDLACSRTDVSSASELLFYLLMELPDIHHDPSRLPKCTASALMTGMTTDTNNLANSVSPATFAMASALIQAGVDRDAILEHLYRSFRPSRLHLMGRLLTEMTITRSGAACMILDRTVQKQFDMQEGETEGFVNLPLSIGKVRMSLFLKEDEGFYRVSIRSKKGVSAQRCASLCFHGGGHEQAAGGKLFFPGDIGDRTEAAAYVEKAAEQFLSGKL